MAVFTPVTFTDAQTWLTRFELGKLIDIEGIASGIENSNFFITVETGAGESHRYVLTLFERLPAEHLPFYLGLMKHLANRGIPCPDPIADRAGHLLGELNGRPAALVTCLSGRANMAPQPAHCAAVGQTLARMHLASADYPGALPNLRGLAWWRQTAPQVQPFLDADQSALLRDVLADQEALATGAAWRALPVSAVHADLFRDNVLFEDTRLRGVIDFYFAGVDSWMFDLAVTCNDWCIDDATGEFDPPRLSALLNAYCAVRRPLPVERECWQSALRAAALRFWLSRLYDLHLPRPAQMVTPKDPREIERILRSRIARPTPLPETQA